MLLLFDHHFVICVADLITVAAIQFVQSIQYFDDVDKVVANLSVIEYSKSRPSQCYAMETFVRRTFKCGLERFVVKIDSHVDIAIQ